jgi:hypothetical protein
MPPPAIQALRGIATRYLPDSRLQMDGCPHDCRVLFIFILCGVKLRQYFPKTPHYTFSLLDGYRYSKFLFKLD